MSEVPRSNNLQWRVSRLEDDVKELKQGQPAVMAERVTRLSTDVRSLREEMHKEIGDLREEAKAGRRVLMGFLVSFAFFGITLVVTLVTFFGSG